MEIYVLAGDSWYFIPSWDPQVLQTAISVSIFSDKKVRLSDDTVAYPQNSLVAPDDEGYSLGNVFQVSSAVFTPTLAIARAPLAR